MKKVVLILIIFISFFMFTTEALAKENIKVYFFHGNGCPHCKDESKFLEKLKSKYSDIEIKKYEVWENKDNQKLMETVKEKMNVLDNGVPFTVIGSTYLIGYVDFYNEKIERIVNFYLDNSDKYSDIVFAIKGNTFKDNKVIDEFKKNEVKTDAETTISMPVIGNVNLKNFSIETTAVIIGLVDGFNPCAMWVLLFLIGMLLGMKNRCRMWTIGITFLVSSALIYMAIMLSWINIIVNISTSILFRNIIAVIAIIGSIININSFIKERKKESGCNVVDSKKRKKIFSKIKRFTTQKSLALALIGVIGLAISVNVVELACSAGLPLVFTQILSINKVTGFKSFYYTFIYIIFFLLDDIIIFIIAMTTTRVAAISTKYNKYSHLIGGVLMFIIGGLLIIKPEWLMFNFD